MVVHGPQVGTCRVCGELTEIYSTASCLQCGGTYHLALRNDIPAKDCGQVWVNDEYQTLEFACDICLGRAAPAESAERDARPGYARAEGRRASEVLRAKRAARNRRSR